MSGVLAGHQVTARSFCLGFSVSQPPFNIKTIPIQLMLLPASELSSCVNTTGIRVVSQAIPRGIYGGRSGILEQGFVQVLFTLSSFFKFSLYVYVPASLILAVYSFGN
jgi:hypothetical protein